MSARTSTRPLDSGAPVVVSAPTLQEAYRIVRRDYGEDAVILGTRTVNRRQELGLGHERQIEVTVQVSGAPAPQSVASRRPKAHALEARPSAPAPAEQQIIREVARIEGLVAAIAEQHARLTRSRHPHCGNALSETLVENGASHDAVETVLTRFTSETGTDVSDRPAALAWLSEHLRASNCGWDEFAGCHAFLGECGSGRTDLVLSAAALLQGRGRRTLVLSVLPTGDGGVRQLQQAASDGGFDAAVIQNIDRLVDVDGHLGEYEVVLVDMPHLRHSAMGEEGPVHGWLARNGLYHRHLLVPLDRDPRDMAPLRAAARAWNCDWIVLSRADLTNRPAKMLDVLGAIPVPVSLVGRDPAGRGVLEIAQSEQLLDAMLVPAVDGVFRPGLRTGHAAAGESGVDG